MPHSEIPGSPIARISPGLFAACHVLHRLSVPRHPPDALVSRLITASPIAMPYHRRVQGRAPCPPRNCGGRRPLLKTLLSDRPQHARACPAGPPRSHHNSLCTLQSTAAQTRGAVANLLQASPLHGATAVPRWRLPVQLCCTWRPAKPGCAGGGGERVRTDDLLLAKQALSQLSYGPRLTSLTAVA